MPAMKQCPQCSAEYDDSIQFCAKDGRALVPKIVSRTRLCPHCANSVPEDFDKCPYCKADLGAAPVPQWPDREESRQAKLAPNANRIPARSKIILVIGVATFALGVFLIGGHQERSESQLVLQQKLAELKEREEQIQAKDQKVQALETQLAQARQQLSENSNQLAELKTKLEESKKDLSVTQQRLNIANREIERLASSRAQAGSRTPARSVDRTGASSPPAPPRRTAEPGIYETIRPTSVYEGPDASGRVLSKISKGTKVDVVRTVGDWLEVRSKHGNPPGFIRRDDAMFVSQAN
jgi:hypothetical protein